MGMMGLGREEVALMVPGRSGSSGGLYRRLKVGEELDGYTLVRIETDRVVMKIGETGKSGSAWIAGPEDPGGRRGPPALPGPPRPAPPAWAPGEVPATGGREHPGGGRPARRASAPPIS